MDPDYNGTVCGALTNDFEWVFARIRSNGVKEKMSFYIQYTEYPLVLMFRTEILKTFGGGATPYSLECLQHIVYLLHFDLLSRQGWSDPATAEQVDGLLRECDVGVKDNADQYIGGVFELPREIVSKSKAELQAAIEWAEAEKAAKENAQAEVARLKAALENANVRKGPPRG